MMQMVVPRNIGAHEEGVKKLPGVSNGQERWVSQSNVDEASFNFHFDQEVVGYHVLQCKQ